MMFASLADVILGLWWVAVMSTLATVLGVRAAWLGVIPKMVGMFGASALGFIAMSYWFDIFGIADDGTIDMRRGAGIALWPALAYITAALIGQSEQAHDE